MFYVALGCISWWLLSTRCCRDDFTPLSVPCNFGNACCAALWSQELQTRKLIMSIVPDTFVHVFFTYLVNADFNAFHAEQHLSLRINMYLEYSGHSSSSWVLQYLLYHIQTQFLILECFCSWGSWPDDGLPLPSIRLCSPNSTSEGNECICGVSP